MARYLALLRGINVGGKNIIKMADLKACFEANGLREVVTYIQSGNVIFTSTEKVAALTHQVEVMLSKAFDYKASVVLRSRAQMDTIVSKAPAGFGSEPDAFRYDVMFLKAPLTVKAALAEVPVNPIVDAVYGGSGALYYRRLISKAAQSKLERLGAMPIYKSMTVRNWNTTTRLLAMM